MKGINENEVENMFNFSKDHNIVLQLIINDYETVDNKIQWKNTTII